MWLPCCAQSGARVRAPRNNAANPKRARVQGFGAEYCGEYIRDTVGRGTFCVGEFWADLSYGHEGLEFDQNGPRQALTNYIDATGRCLSMFDFPTKGILQEAVNGQLWRLSDGDGKPPGLLGWWAKRAVTFIDNHDTGEHTPKMSCRIEQHVERQRTPKLHTIRDGRHTRTPRR